MAENGFTEREQKLMSLAWRCFDGEPKVDYQKLANLAGMSNPRSASNAWAVIKKKLAAQADANGDVSNGGTASPTKPKATPNKKRGKKAAAEADDDDEQEAPSAKKVKTPKSGRKKKSVTPEDDGGPGFIKEENGDDEGGELV